jgi:hypothetical protein
MSAKWLSVLVRARQLQEDAAQQELAEAQRRALRAHGYVRLNAERLEALSAEETQVMVPAFVAAAVALQAAAATHAAAVAAAEQAGADRDEQRVRLLEAASARLTAEDLHEQALSRQALRRGAAEQREHDEVAATVHRRQNSEPTP